MGFLVLSSRNIHLLFILIISALLFSTSFAGATRKFTDKPAAVRVGAVAKEMQKKFFHSEEDTGVHQRILKVKTNDYGSYGSAPAFVKPPYKLIPN